MVRVNYDIRGNPLRVIKCQRVMKEQVYPAYEATIEQTIEDYY